MTGDMIEQAAPSYESATGRMRENRLVMGKKLALQILDCCAPFLQKPTTHWDVLDCGSGYGQTAIALAEHCRSVKGIEPSKPLYDFAVAWVQQVGIRNVLFQNLSVESLHDLEQYDLAVLDNVFEHISDQPKALCQLAQSLRPGGLLFMIVPNKLWPIEVHYGLPFLSYLPVPLANVYLRATGRGTDYTDASYAPTYWKLRTLLRLSGFGDHQFIVPPDLSKTMLGAVWYYRLGAALLRRFPALWSVSKSFVVVARKTNQK